MPLVAFDLGLNQPIRWKWENGQQTVPIDRDIAGNPIVNSAGTPYPPQSRLEGTLRLRVTRNEPYYDVQKALLPKDRFNSDQITIPGAGTLQPGQMFCTGIDCVNETDINSLYATLAYNFELVAPEYDAEGNILDANFGPKIKLLDQGDKGWYAPLMVRSCSCRRRWATS